MTAHLNETPPEPVTLRADLPSGLNEIIMMAIAKDPANRFQTADAFRAALSSVEVSDLPTSHTTAVTPSPKGSGATTLVDTPHTPRIPTTPAPPRTPAPVRAATPPPATVPMTAPQTAAAGVVPPPAARPSSSRGLWLALGVVLSLVVLVSAATYIPRHLGTHADPKKTAIPAADSSTTTPATSTAPGSTTATDASTPEKPIVSLQGSEGSLKVDANGNVALDSPEGSMRVNASTGAVTMTDKSGKAKKDLSAGNPAPTRQDAAPPAPPVPPGPTPEEIAKVEDEADKLNVRAETATQSVETLRHQQQASGYNLRADIASSEQRMQLFMSKGNSALKAQDLVNAQKYFDQADAELTKLEKFLGH